MTAGAVSSITTTRRVCVSVPGVDAKAGQFARKKTVRRSTLRGTRQRTAQREKNPSRRRNQEGPFAWSRPPVRGRRHSGPGTGRRPRRAGKSIAHCPRRWGVFKKAPAAGRRAVAPGRGPAARAPPAPRTPLPLGGWRAPGAGAPSEALGARGRGRAGPFAPPNARAATRAAAFLQRFSPRARARRAGHRSRARHPCMGPALERYGAPKADVGAEPGLIYGRRVCIRADARPRRFCAGGSRTGDPSKKTGGGTLAAPARTPPQHARSARALAADAARRQPEPIQKNRRRHARGAGPNAPEARGRWTRRRPRPRRSPGLAGRARPSWPPRGRPRPMPTPARRDRTAAGPVRRLTRGRRRGRPTRGRRGRATRRRSCGARPPEARPGAAEPRARLGGRHAARRVCSQRSQRSRAQNAGSARARRPRSRKEASRRGSRSPTAASTRNCVRKGGSMPPFGADRLPLALNSMVD